MSIQNYNQIYIFRINLMKLLPVHLLAKVKGTDND